MKILLLGKDGQIGWELQRSLAPLGDLVACGRKDADFEDLNALCVLVERHAPQIIVNAAAYTSVDKAESEPERAQRINGDAVAVLADIAARTNAWLVHYSTDYVFNGECANPYTEEDTPTPRSTYGRSKFAGEEAIRAARCQHLIFRTSWVFAVRGENFATTMLRLAAEREELCVISDQLGAPTGAELIADVTALALCRLRCAAASSQGVASERGVAFSQGSVLSGTYHLAAGGETTWHGYASYVVSEALRLGATLKVDPKRIHAIATKDYPSQAPRPANSRLETGRLCSTFQLTLPHWQVHVKRLINELIENSRL